MQISKFGGASVKNANAIRNLHSIVETFEKPQVIVVSAMGKMTNAFETLVAHYFSGLQPLMESQFNAIKDYHETIIADLFGETEEDRVKSVRDCLLELENRLQQPPSLHFDFEYDQIVSYGELLSTLIVSAYLNKSGFSIKWIDIRQVLKTDDLYRDANVDWKLTEKLMRSTFSFDDCPFYITQGFLGGTISNISTTLGREGSDYTAAIIGHTLNAEKVTVWKDVPGILNADPDIFPEAEKLETLSYQEIIELSYYGAKVIHPKTLKPLQNKQIPLYVKSFLNPGLSGTVIRQEGAREFIPIYILKTNQVFMTLSPLDFSFIAEDNMSEILSLFSQFRVKINLLQTSALNFTACVDNLSELKPLINTLKERFTIRYNDNIELLTIRYYTHEAINEKTKGREVIDSQITRKNARFVLRAK